MNQVPKATGYTIQIKEKSLLVEMSSLTKTKHGIGVLKKATMILFPYMKKKNKQWEGYKRLLLHFLHQLVRLQQHHPYWNALVEGHCVIEVYKRFMR